jgi:CRP-like cAMP-binding protein
MIDIDKLKHVFPFLLELSASDVFTFFKNVNKINLAAGEVFIKEGSTKKHVYYINKGLVRSYFIDEKGEEITNRLRSENQIVAGYEIVFFNKPSRFTYQAIEKTELFEVDYHVLQKILEGNLKLQPARVFFLTQALAESLRAVDNFILLNPEQRYLNFIEQNPDLINRVPNKYIANVLGITPVSLSRIRKRISSKHH